MRRLPSDAELAQAQLVFIAGLDPDRRDELAKRAQDAGKIVHAEDAKPVTDIHVPAILRRGDLAIAVSTSGKAPGLAVELRNCLGRLIGPEWRERLEEDLPLAARLDEAGAAPDIVARRTGEWMRGWNWLPEAETGFAPPSAPPTNQA